jgi:glycosyltransferase involved in cell wall biosynthesis
MSSGYPTVSVIVPAYNRAHLIGRALESLRRQTYRDFEVVLGDDGSTDNTIAVAQKAWPELKVARLPVNRGASSARNAAICASSGHFLAFLDSDDEWLPEKLAVHMDYLHRHPEVAVCACAYRKQWRDGRTTLVPAPHPEDLTKALHSALDFHGASTPVVRREVLDEVGFQDEELRILEDWDWMLRISQHHRIEVLDEPLAIIHENNPSPPDRMRDSTVIFLAKHDADFRRYGAAHRSRVISQQWENSAFNMFEHGRPCEGLRLLLRSLRHAPLRNPASAVLVPLGAIDAAAGTSFARMLLAWRGAARQTARGMRQAEYRDAAKRNNESPLL